MYLKFIFITIAPHNAPLKVNPVRYWVVLLRSWLPIQITSSFGIQYLNTKYSRITALWINDMAVKSTLGRLGWSKAYKAMCEVVPSSLAATKQSSVDGDRPALPRHVTDLYQPNKWVLCEQLLQLTWQGSWGHSTETGFWRSSYSDHVCREGFTWAKHLNS